MKKFKLKLYVMGKTARSEAAITNLQAICSTLMEEKYELSIIDVLEQPQLAEEERIIATPTLIKVLPPPIRRLIGDLSDKQKVLVGLDIRSESVNLSSKNKKEAP